MNSADNNINSKFIHIVKKDIFILVYLFTFFILADDTTNSNDTNKKFDIISESLNKSINTDIKNNELHINNNPNTSNNDFKVINRLNEIIKLGKVHFPNLKNDLNSDDKQDKLINLLLQELDGNLKFYKNKEDIPSYETIKPIKKPKYYPCVRIALNKVIYFRLDIINNDILKQFRKNIFTLLSSSRKSVGIIIDLRMSQYGEIKNLENLSKFFKKRFDNETIVILTGNKTRGASEIFTALMKEFLNVLVVGEKSYGEPFQLMEFRLKKIGFITGYKKPSFYTKNLKNIIPNLTINAYPQISPSISLNTEKEDVLNGEKYDSCIQTAIDIIVAKYSVSDKTRSVQNNLSSF